MGKLFDWALLPEYFIKLISGVPMTLMIFFIVSVLAMIIGVFNALIRVNKIPVLYQVVSFLVSYTRCVPGLVQLFIMYYGLPIVLYHTLGTDCSSWDPILFVIAAYTVNTATFFGEAMRTAILSIDKGQKEAGYSVGLNAVQIFFRIIFPQVLYIALPTIEISACTLLKDTSLAYVIGVTTDVMGKATLLGGRTYHILEADVSATIIFCVLNIVLYVLFRLLQNRYFRFYHVKAER